MKPWQLPVTPQERQLCSTQMQIHILLNDFSGTHVVMSLGLMNLSKVPLLSLIIKNNPCLWRTLQNDRGVTCFRKKQYLKKELFDLKEWAVLKHSFSDAALVRFSCLILQWYPLDDV